MGEGSRRGFRNRRGVIHLVFQEQSNGIIQLGGNRVAIVDGAGGEVGTSDYCSLLHPHRLIQFFPHGIKINYFIGMGVVVHHLP